MNKIKIMATMLVAFFVINTSYAQRFEVKIRPNAPVVGYHRPLAPSPRHIWVEPEWTWRNGRYEYVQGYWALPDRGRRGWAAGHWKRTRGGWYWVPGHWR